VRLSNETSIQIILIYGWDMLKKKLKIQFTDDIIIQY